MAYNAANRKDVRRAEKAAKLAEERRGRVVTELMKTIDGRWYVLEKLEECHVYATSFSRDALAMAFMEGQRDIGLKILSDLNWCPDEYNLMMRENNERRSTGERTGSPDANGRDQGRDTTPGAPIDDYGSEADDDGSAEDGRNDNSVHYDR